MRIVRFRMRGWLSRLPRLMAHGQEFAVSPGTIALQVGDAFYRPSIPSFAFDSHDHAPKEIVPLIMDDGSTAWAVCAVGGWEPWIAEI